MYAAGLADEAEKILNKEQVSDSLPFGLLHGKIEPNSSGARIDNRRWWTMNLQFFLCEFEIAVGAFLCYDVICEILYEQ